DGKTVAYIAEEGAKRFIMRGERRMPSSGIVGPPCFSPEGTSLAYVTGTGEALTQLMIDGKADLRVVTPRRRLADPAFSPDGKHLAYRAKTVGGSELITVDRSDEPEEFDMVAVPRFSPDSSTVAYVATRGSKQLVVVGKDVGEKFSK